MTVRQKSKTNCLVLVVCGLNDPLLHLYVSVISCYIYSLRNTSTHPNMGRKHTVISSFEAVGLWLLKTYEHILNVHPALLCPSSSVIQCAWSPGRTPRVRSRGMMGDSTGWVQCLGPSLISPKVLGKMAGHFRLRRCHDAHSRGLNSFNLLTSPS